MIIGTVTTDSAIANNTLRAYWELKDPMTVYHRRPSNAFDALPSSVKHDIAEAWALGSDDLFARTLTQLYCYFELAPEEGFKEVRRKFNDGIAAAVSDRLRRGVTTTTNAAEQSAFVDAPTTCRFCSQLGLFLANTSRWSRTDEIDTENLPELEDLPPLID